MPRKKNKNMDWDDWDDAPDASEIPTGDNKQFQVYLRDFVIEEKVTAFQSTYTPAPETMDDRSEYVEVFDDARLRQYFKAYVCGLGDPLKLYIEDLKLAGFRMRVSITGKPCLFVIRKA